jgi:hypothetical protein
MPAFVQDFSNEVTRFISEWPGTVEYPDAQ